MASLKLISINIERSKHLGLVLPFLEREQADVVCVQELFERDIPAFERVLGPLRAYAPMTRWLGEGEPALFCVGIFSKLPTQSTSISYYTGDGTIVDRDASSIQTSQRTIRNVLVVAEIEKDGALFCVATTHFTWTPDGRADKFQREALQKMLALPSLQQDVVFAGDFNAPRGQEIFSALANRWQDNIPQSYTSSIDGTLHHAGKIPYMVDGLFTSPRYKASNVSLVSCVSDHCAVVATITAP